MIATAERRPSEAESSFLEVLRAQYESKGYDFVAHPQRSSLPDFFASYVPDAVAFKDGSNVAIEVKTRATPASQQSIQRIRKLFEGRPEWQFIVAYMGSDAYQSPGLPVADRAMVLKRADDVVGLVSAGDTRAAFVIAWSLLEAALNSVDPRADKRPRSPGTVLQTLAMDGHISEETERSLRALIDLRNRIVHGDLAADPSEQDVQQVLRAVHATLAVPVQT